MYLVIRNFVDLEDKCHKYVAGEEYPRKGYEPAAERIKELVEGNNKAGVKLIKKVKGAKAEPKAEPKVEPKAEPEEKPKKKKTTKKKAAPKGGKKASK